MSLNERLISVGGGAAACTTDSVNPFGPNDAFSSNIALYQLDGNANDTTTNYNGTPTDITYGAGYIDQAAVFNGSSSRIDTPSNLLRDTFSLSCWVKINNLPTRQNLMGNAYDGSNFGCALQVLGTSGYVQFEWSVSNSWLTLTSSVNVTDGQWHNVVVIISEGSQKLYVDNLLAASSSQSNDQQPNNAPFKIGANWNNTEYTSGSIDQVRIFDSALTAENVATLYAETAATASNTNPFGQGSGVALYTLDYDSSDAGGLYDGAPTNVEFGVGGQINYGAGFNGSTSRITTGLTNTVFNNFTDYSISMWVNPSLLDSNRFFAGTTNSSALNGIYLSVQSTGEIRFFERNSTTTATALTSTDTISLNTWSHIIAVRNGSTNYLYVNNGTPVSATNSSITHDATFEIGRAGSYNSNLFPGDIDQVRVFQSALDSTQVTQLYNETACVYTCTTDTVDYPTTNLAYYKLDNSATDETGTYDGTPTNINYTFGRFGQAADFSGGASYVNLNSAVLPASVFSVSLWINLDSLSTAWLFSQYTGGATGRFIFNVTPTGGFQINVTSTNSLATTNIPVITVGNWYHVVIVKDGSNGWTLYADGTPHSTWNSTENILTNQNTVLGGDDSVTGNNMIGRLDQVRIFSSALTSTQVESLYNEYQCEDTSTFKTVLYTGNGSTQYVSNVGFEPDLTWIKDRGAASGHWVNDSVRGAGNGLMTQSTGAEITSLPELMSSFDSNGFTVGYISNNTTNFLNNSYVAWNWKAGGAAVSNTDGTITSQVSANVDAGFSIVSYTGSGSASATVGHGLNAAPEMYIIKSRGTGDWWVYNENLNGGVNPASYFLRLNLTSGETLNAGSPPSIFAGIEPTASVFSIGLSLNGSSTNYIAYCWHSVAGVSNMGTYTGSSGTVSVSGLGFKPSFVIVKNYTNTANWGMYDLVRGTVSDQMNNLLYPNLANAETGGQSTYVLTANSDGFVVSAANHLQLNIAGSSYIYMAFA